MTRINTVTYETASAEQKALFDAIRSPLGMVPNFLKVFANSPVALALAQQNRCQYGLFAHTVIGRKAGLDSAEIEANRAGASRDVKAAVAVRFARAPVEHQGEIATAELLEMRDAGYSEPDVVEVITRAGMNFLTPILGKAGRVDIDFPRVELKQLAA